MTTALNKFETNQIDEARKVFHADGYVIFESILPPKQIADLHAALAPFLAENLSGRNDFEGLKTNRVYALLAKDPVFADLAIHPLVMDFVDAEFGPSALLSSCLAINLHPGETVQPWHFDDAHINIDRPHPPYGLSAFWALDDTTQENGATEIIPGSHTWPENEIPGSVMPASFDDTTTRAVSDDPGSRADAVKAVMLAGSLMLTKGTLWHRGGSNRSGKPRMIITPQYGPGWARQLENMMATMSAAEAAKLPLRAQQLLGYSIHPPFMGYVDGQHPNKVMPNLHQ